MASTRTQEILERPVLEFPGYGLALHLAAGQAAGPRPMDEPGVTASAADEKALASFERDMMSYAYRVQPPLNTRIVTRGLPVTAHFKYPWSFESEGLTYTLRHRDAAKAYRHVPFRVSAARTEFPRSGISILHMVFAPGSDQLSALSEFDLIKLSKLWEGGEGFPEMGSRAEEHDDRITFLVDHKRLSIRELSHFLFGNGWRAVGAREALPFAASEAEQSGPFIPESVYRVGTISLGPPTAGGDELMHDVRVLCAEPEFVFDPDTDRGARLLAFGGIVQALLDFREVDADELRDVFTPLDIGEASIFGVHKGTLLSMNCDETALRPYALDVSPYLIVPHALSLHNEERLRRAGRLLELAAPGPRKQQDGGALANAFRRPSRYPLSISMTLDHIDEASATLAQVTPNIFHYPQERRVFELTRNRRGLEPFEQTVRDDLKTAEREIGIRQQRRAARDVVVALILTALGAVLAAAAQESRVLPLAVVVVIWVAVIAGYLAYRRRE